MSIQIGAFFPTNDMPAERWVTVGATNVTFYTSGQGIGAVEQQIEAMNQFYDAVR